MFGTGMGEGSPVLGTGTGLCSPVLGTGAGLCSGAGLWSSVFWPGANND